MEVCEHSAPLLRGSVFQLVAVVLIIVFFSLLLRTSLRYPYYYMWDMDEISTVDTVMINSGLLPDHLNHPGFGMYLALSMSSRIARAFNVLSASTLTDLRDSLNPLAGMAETTDYFRRHTPYLILAMVLALWFSLRLLFGLPRLAALLALAFLAFQESLFYQASMIRTEFYSLLFFCFAVFLVAVAIRTRRGYLSPACIFLAGIMLSLSFLTKIQALFFVAAFPFIMMLGFSLHESSEERFDASLSIQIWTTLISLANVVAFGALLAFAYKAEIPDGYVTFTKEYRITGLAIVSGAALAALFGTQVLALFSSPFRRSVFGRSRLLVYLASGLLFAFLLHFFARNGATYMLYDFKILFLRHNPFELSLTDIRDHVRDLWDYAPVLFCGHFVLLGLLVIGSLARVVAASWRQVALCVMLTGFGLTHVLLGTRFILRDLMWVEILFSFLSLAYLSLLIRFAVRGRPVVIGLALVCITVCFATNLCHLRYVGNRIDANYNIYGWERHKWFAGIYNFNAAKYTQVMNHRYNSAMWEVARANTDRYAENRRTAEFVFQNQVITQRNLGIVAQGFPVCAKNLSFTLATYPPELGNALLVDSASVPLNKNVYLRPAEVREHSERLDKFRESVTTGTLAVLPRNDLKVFLFAPDGDLAKIDTAQTRATKMNIVMTKDGKPLGVGGVEIVKYCEIPVNKFTGGYYFFVILNTGK